MRTHGPGLLNFWIRPGRGGLVLLIAVVVGYLILTPVNHATGGGATAWLGLSRAGLATGRIWQPLTYWLLHRTPMHLLFNAFLLFVLCRPVEHQIGTRRLGVLVVASLLIGGLAWLAWSPSIVVGCSGIVFALIGAFVALGPHRPILLFFILEMPAWCFGAALVVIELIMWVTYPQGETAYVVHLAGGATGFLLHWPPLRARWEEIVRRGRIRRRGWQVIEGGRAAPVDVDAILDKISRQGMGSLSEKERSALDEASRRRGRD